MELEAFKSGTPVVVVVVSCMDGTGEDIAAMVVTDELGCC